jgi:hypothetical protein
MFKIFWKIAFYAFLEIDKMGKKSKQLDSLCLVWIFMDQTLGFFLPNQKSSFNQEDPNSMSQRVHSITIVLLCSSIISLQFTNWSRALSHLVAQYIDYNSKIHYENKYTKLV